MSFPKTKIQPQPGHPSWMPLAEANHQLQPGHPSRMPLAEANQQSLMRPVGSFFCFQY